MGARQLAAAPHPGRERWWFAVGHEPWLLPPVLQMVEALGARGVAARVAYAGAAGSPGDLGPVAAWRVPRRRSIARLAAPFELGALLRRRYRADGAPDVLVACDPLALQAVQLARPGAATRLGYWAFELPPRPQEVRLSADYYRARSLGSWIAGADFLVAPSASRLAAARAAFRRPIPSLIVYNGRRLGPRAARPVPAFLDHPASRLPVRLLYAGRVSPTHHVPEMIDALSALPDDIGLVIAGPAEPEYRTELARRVERAGLAARCVVLERVEHVELEFLLTRCQIGLVLYDASRGGEASDPAPNKLGDYLARQLAVIGTAQPYLRFWLEERGAGTCVGSVTPAALAGAVRWLLSDGRLPRAQARARAAAEAELDMDVQADTLVAFVRDLERPALRVGGR